MPRIRHIPGPYHVYFVSFDCAEAPHVHVAREKMEAKLWLDPISVAHNYGFGTRELSKMQRLISTHRNEILEAWREHCNEA